MLLVKRFASGAINKSTGSPAASAVGKVINSHQKVSSKEEASQLNEVRVRQLYAYQRESAQTRRKHAQYAQSLPTREARESLAKSQASFTRQASWDKYVEGVKRCLNPPIKELQAAGKIPSVNLERKKEKIERGQVNLMQAMKQSTLMRRKYLNFLSTETIPNLVTRDNLEAKIQEALEAAGTCHNFSAEDVVGLELSLKRKLREIRVPMDDFSVIDKNELEAKQQP